MHKLMFGAAASLFVFVGVGGCAPPEVCVEAMAAYKVAVTAAPFDQSAPAYDHFLELADSATGRGHATCKAVVARAAPVRAERAAGASQGVYVEAGMPNSPSMLESAAPPKPAAPAAAARSVSVTGAPPSGSGVDVRCNNRCLHEHSRCRQKATSKDLFLACDAPFRTCNNAC